jgi:cullin-associated NEDD8-dissociated protein 1
VLSCAACACACLLVYVLFLLQGALLSPEEFDAAPFVRPLFDAILRHLRAHDIDSEIKKAAITSMGLLLAYLGDLVADNLPAVLPLFLERLRNEVTRDSVLKALTFVAESPLRVNLSSVLTPAVEELGSLLRQHARSLKQATLSTLIALAKHYGTAIPTDSLRNVRVALLAAALCPPACLPVCLSAAFPRRC